MEDPFLLESRHTKSQMSIPYMDASLPPTPKVVPVPPSPLRAAGVGSAWRISSETTTATPWAPCQVGCLQDSCLISLFQRSRCEDG